MSESNRINTLPSTQGAHYGRPSDEFQNIVRGAEQARTNFSMIQVIGDDPYRDSHVDVHRDHELKNGLLRELEGFCRCCWLPVSEIYFRKALNDFTALSDNLVIERLGTLSSFCIITNSILDNA